MIKAVLYDMGDIFFESYKWRYWLYKYIMKKYKYSGNFYHFYKDYNLSLINVYLGNNSYINSFKLFLSNIIEEKNIENLVKEALQKKSFFENNRKLYSNVIITLKKLYEAGIINIIITNSELSRHEIRNEILLKFKISEYIHYIVSSIDIGIIKPDPRIYEHPLIKFNMLNENTVFISHDKDEIEGAKKLGIKTIEYNNFFNIETFADYKVNKFLNIITLIESM